MSTEHPHWLPMDRNPTPQLASHGAESGGHGWLHMARNRGLTWPGMLASHGPEPWLLMNRNIHLMITGNLAMLAGVEPHALHAWYLSVYADAYEWVELPNTVGMSQFADGGLLASKPYAASGAYINRMSNYCSSCAYDVKQRTGPKACPFNSLYWDFTARSRTKIGGNPRMAQTVRTYDNFAPDERQRIAESAANFLANLLTEKRYTRSTLPEKDCAACGRPFAWRKKWARDWEFDR